MKYMWVEHKETGEKSIACYVGGGRWQHFKKVMETIGLLDHIIIKEIEHLEAEQRPRHEHGHHKAVSGILKMTKTLNVGGTSTATVTFQDKAGADVNLPEGNKPTWTVDQAALLSLTVADDGMSAELTATGVGLATITVTAEGDPTPGVDTITVSGSVNIVDEASSATLTFS